MSFTEDNIGLLLPVRNRSSKQQRYYIIISITWTLKVNINNDA